MPEHKSADGEGAAVVTRVRRRRSPAEVRQVVLRAARALFSARGYGGTGIRDVALEAGATEAAIYRHFGSKLGLFEAAVAEPYHAFFTDYMSNWRAHGTGTAASNRELIGGFIGGLYDLLDEHRSLILSYIAFNAFEPDAFNSSHPGDSAIFQEFLPIEEWMRNDQELLGFHDLDIPVTLRVCVGMTMSAVLFDDVLFASGPRRPSRERVVREITTLILRGVECRRCEHPTGT